MREDVFKYYQDTTLKRGFPPVPLEIALYFGIETREAVAERNEIGRRLGEITVKVELPKQNAPEVVNADLRSLKLPVVQKKNDLAKFTGRNGWSNPHDRMIYWSSVPQNVYVRGSVDFVLHDEQIALTPETEAWFYGAEAARLPKYKRGTRRFLEQVVEETTAGCKTDRAKAMALVRLIGNRESNPYRHRDPNWQPFLGGTEEEVLKKAWSMCNEISRVLAFLCQIAGMPARCLFLFTEPATATLGHAMTEIFFDGKWNLIEQNQGIMYLKQDGYFASAVEMRDQPEIINARKDVGGGLSRCHAQFTGPVSIIPYSIDKTDHYTYVWQTNESL